ncbi:nitrite reductase large subunit [Bermanella marisrubri]|uniref:BFD-like (2Fe-2S)-binding region n=1 Tax=Bermanella marisrubri TaxID=207949 RepID=Q1N0F1_9GAMM|nr:nitrite reductase large subunit NirB [Bermanella marisrubri]EAT11713.1 BFD-like (2Fe-2S)-binding region [Oceanobacter sp. RED65] [Bermanella marisrubri]QIZ83252.1 nitrite reductase large subunit [Bermanella marisrubri]
MSNKQDLIVIGNGMVGQKFLQTLADKGKHESFNITVLCEEPRPAYDRVYLSSYFSGKTADDLSLVEKDFFNDNQIEIKLNCKAESIDRENQLVKTSHGENLHYDKLILATGSYPFVPPVEGHDREHCLVYRTIEDLENIEASAKESKVGVVVGGGLLGLEAAKALKDLGLKTHVVEFAPRLMAVQVDDAGGALLKRKIEELGVQVHTSKNTQLITDGDTLRHKMEFADGESLETDLILFSAGIRPQDAIAKQAELELGPRGGIIINNHCQTSDENIYAIGECALWGGMIYGLVAPGYAMASVAVDHITQTGDSEFAGADMSTKLKLMGVDVASIGDCHGRTEGSLSYAYNDEVNQVYKKLVVSADKKQLLGAIMVGEAEDYGNLLQMMLNNIELPEKPELLILPSTDGMEKPALGPDALPETAQICSCYDVSKGQICCSVQDGAQTIGDVKASTSAATGCGGCTALVTQVMNSELEKLGVEVNTDICEHFAYTRQDLYNIIRVEGIESFQELLEKHGKGHGCEICKPAVGSILASVYNDYVLDEKHISLQDTNDIYLGNMQKDGTYSVVPRMPGGEVTPEGLLVIGQIAKDFGLYTKITGGQRIDLFGAQLHELPQIWKRLVDAGFETGHAYGKALRTVKSCVGSTWCRYGVDDSMSLSIEVENRYKGLRAPHKIKFAVSGCTRECAEAQSKDVGIIATENGWNLYVCGNGGMKPRHAELLAQDLDKETLIKYIDRFLMFYIKTADRLQRTSVWRDNLEGGLDYLKSVVVDDSLGLAEELEQQMQHVVGTYQCEWKSTIENPERLKRFKHFINADDTDKNLQFVKERGQIRPANEDERLKKDNLITVG